MEYENKDICRVCKKKCCKKCGCDYYVEDFEVINKESMIKILDTGNVSVVSSMVIKDLKKEERTITPFLYLRARNVGRDVIDLLSLKRQCLMLKKDGCSYSLKDRPSGGVNFIPQEDFKCKRCDDPLEEIRKWEPYQNLLYKMVRRYAHMSVDERFKLDVLNLFVDILNENFEGVVEEEIKDVLSCLTNLSMCFPEEFECAKRKCLLTSKVLRSI